MVNKPETLSETCAAMVAFPPPPNIAPMTYIQLPTAMLLGILIFSDWPNAVALAGSAIIIGAGLYLWQNTRPKREEQS